MIWELRIKKQVRKSLSRFPKKDQLYIVHALQQTSRKTYGAAGSAPIAFSTKFLHDKKLFFFSG